MLIIDIIGLLPSLFVNCVDFVEVVSVGIVLVAFGFISSLVSSRNI